jgi:hypothetical protein
VADEHEAIEAEVPAHGVEVVHVVVDAALEKGRIGHGLGAASVPHVVEDERPARREAREVLQQMEAVRQDHHLRT